MVDFLIFEPGAEVLDRGLILPGNGCVKLTDNGNADGISSAGDYAGVATAQRFSASAAGFQTIYDGGSIYIGFGSNVAGTGPAVIAVVSSGAGNAYVKRFAIDLRNDLRSVEWLYLQDIYFRLVIDGTEILAAATGGTDDGIEAYSGPVAFGGTADGNPALQRALALHPSVVGTGWDASSTGLADPALGVLAWAMVQRDAGVPENGGAWLAFDDDLSDSISGSTLDPEWLGIGSPTFGDPSIPTYIPSGGLKMQIQQLSAKIVTRISGGGTGGSPGAPGQSVEVRGQWVNGSTYVYRDIVYNNGSSYICMVSHSANAFFEPGVGASWTAFWSSFAVSSINDAATGTTSTWSSSKISTDLAGKAASSHTHAAADINAGTFANARVAQSNVTQHQAAIDHNQLLNYAAERHRAIDDGSAGLTDLWSASKISSELALKAGTSHTHLVTDIISGGAFPASFISQIAVTQHAGAIDHGLLLGRTDNDHTQYLTNTITGSMFSNPAQPYGPPPQNTIETANIATGFIKLVRSTDGFLPAKTPLDMFAMYDGATFIGGWRESGGMSLGQTGNLDAPSGNFWFWNAPFVIGASGQLWMTDRKPIRFFEALTNGSHYISIAAPDGLGGNIDYRLPSAPVASGMMLTVGFGGADTGIMKWESKQGTAFPTTDLYTGRKFYRTDLGESFTYDDGSGLGSPAVARWISDEQVTFTFANNVTSGVPGTINLRLPGNAQEVRDGLGKWLESSYMLVQAVFASAQSCTATANIRHGGSLVGTVVITTDFANSLGRDQSNWLDFASGDTLWANITLTAGTIDDPVLELHLKRYIAA